MKIKQSELSEPGRESLKVVQTVTRQTDFQKANEDAQSKFTLTGNIYGRSMKYFIYQCGGKFVVCGGWADRLKGIVIAYLISQVTNRTFGISITHPPCDLQRFLLPNQIAWNINASDVALRSKNHTVGFYRKTDNIRFYNSIHTLNFDEDFQEDVVYFQANLDYVDNFKRNPLYVDTNVWMANLTRDEVYAKVYHQLFSLHPDIQSEVTSFLKVAKPTTSHKLVCAHVRAEYGAGHSLSENDTLKIWKFLNQYNDPDKYKIYIASDSERIREQAHDRFDNILHNVGYVVHIDRFTNRTGVCDAMKKIIIDQNILINCDVLLLTFSGFGRMAAYLRQKESGLFCLVKHKITKCSARTLKELYKVYG